MKGGKRPNAGRKSISEELGTRDLARNAIIKRFGSLENGMLALLQMEEQALTKFVFEHAIGKTPDKVDITTNGNDITNAPQEVIIRDYSKKK